MHFSIIEQLLLFLSAINDIIVKHIKKSKYIDEYNNNKR